MSTHSSIRAWRLIKARFANKAFTGEGARFFGGRWNSPGIPVIYTSATASLAVLEVFANVQSADLIGVFMLISCHFDEAFVTRVSPRELPKNWKRSPAPPELRAIGDDWMLRGTSPVLAVPSAIIESELNYLINPRHKDFQRIQRSRPEPFRFNLRLVK